MSWMQLRPQVYTAADAEAVRHLFEVTAGLDSVAAGEDEIQGQVRAAYAAALEVGAVGDQLPALFSRAIAVGRRVRRQTALGAVRRSLGRTAVDIASAELGKLATPAVVVIGAGKLAEVVVDRLLELRLARLVICGRTPERAARLAGRGGEVLPFSRLHAGMVAADAVICCTAAPHRLIERPDVSRVMTARGGRPLLLVDLSVPRAVQPEAASVPGVRLLDLERLGQDVIQDAAPLGSALEQGRTIVQAEVQRFVRWCTGRQASGVVTALRRRFEEICQRELERRLRGRDSLAADEVEAVMQGAMAKLLHGPTMMAREAVAAGDEPALRAISRMFGI